MRRRHAMRYGAEIRGDRTAFRLWAPSASRIDLLIGEGAGERTLPMTARDEGWFEAETGDAGAGARYGFRLENGLVVPDPASRSNPNGVHGRSEVVDPERYEWSDGAWRGRPWHEAVLYELHIGTFTPQGTFVGAIERLDDLVDLGITAIDVMPVASFPGSRGWGYDGVLPFAPHRSYGTPDDFKRLVEAAHARGLMVLLDVVYNHFGPEGNYLHAYAPQFFNARHRTPWGAAIDFDADGRRTVRDFFIDNALYWLIEFHLDGLRLDAVDAIADDSPTHVVAELCATVRARIGDDRHAHLVLENDANESWLLERAADGRARYADAQWNDDFHHALHVLATGETDGYYADYADQPVARFGRALTEGFVYQDDASSYRGGKRRGEPSGHLPPTAFVAFAQNHDQVGNRAFGERIGAIADGAALRALTACLLLAPAPPMLFMGEEFAASSPFLYFCDLGPELARAVSEGRRDGFAKLERFRDPWARKAIPDANARSTFERSKLRWEERHEGEGARWLAFCRSALEARRRHVVPWLRDARHGGTYDAGGSRLRVRWPLGSATLHLVANLGTDAIGETPLPGELVFATHDMLQAASGAVSLPAWSAAFALERA